MSALSTAAIVGIAGATATVGAAAIGASASRKQRKSAERQAKKAGDIRGAAAQKVEDFKFRNVYENIGDGATYDPSTISASQTSATGYDAAQAQGGTLGPAAQASAQGYSAQGYTAGQASLRNLAGGADFLSNPFANLQVGTAAADLQGAQTDQALAASLESGAITGGGGATALARAAAGSKANISANIQQQELQNSQLRAQGQQTLEQGLLAQSNAGQQFASQQDQFNVGQRNQASAFTAAANNQASQFGAAAANQASQFNASSANQFAQSQFSSDNQFALSNQAAQNQALGFNAQAQNQAANTNAQLSQQANSFNAQAFTAADQFAAQQANERELLRYQGQDQQQEREYNQQVNLLNSAGGQAAQASQNAIAARNASAQTTGAALGAVGGAVNSLSNIDFSSKSSSTPKFKDINASAYTGGLT